MEQYLLLSLVLDNFGLNGGRNGFLSIQGGKVDNNFSIIFSFIDFVFT